MVLRLSRSSMLAWESMAARSAGQAGGFQKALVGRGGNGEALGHRQADAVADLAEVGHLAAHRRGQFPVQGRQGQDKRGIRDSGDRFQLRQHLGLKALADGDQVGLIAIMREEIEGGHHAGDLFAQVMHLGRDIAGVKDVIAGKFFLHVRHDFQGLVVVVEEAPEMGKFFLQADLFALLPVL